MNNPILKNFKNFLLYILFWIIVFILNQSLLSLGLLLPLNQSIWDNLIFVLLLFGLGLSFWYSASYISFENNSTTKILLSHLVGAVLASVIWLGAGSIILINIINLPPFYTDFFIETLPWRFLLGILFYFLVTAFYYVVIYYTSYHERIVKETELKNLITEAELRSLKFQINPHFIFNSLNSMSALTTINPDKARTMILKLADFLRYTLASNEKQTTRLKDELKNIRLYLEIEKIRFEDKFEYLEEIAEGCLEVKVPNMILQPLFENAIKHAVYESLGKVTLKLECARGENDFMVVSLKNNFEEGSSEKKGAGVGLANIKNRLALIYSRNDLIEVKKDQNLFTVILYIPCNN